jgi:hypothetical protein
MALLRSSTSNTVADLVRFEHGRETTLSLIAAHKPSAAIGEVLVGSLPHRWGFSFRRWRFVGKRFVRPLTFSMMDSGRRP